MSNLIDIQAQIEKLQKQASDIKAKEFHSTVQEILVKMQAFGITVKDLQTTKPGKRGPKGRKAAVPAKAPKAARKASKPAPIKYRGPNGETWTGRGLTPKWLKALIAEGQPQETFAVSS